MRIRIHNTGYKVIVLLHWYLFVIVHLTSTFYWSVQDILHCTKCTSKSTCRPFFLFLLQSIIFILPPLYFSFFHILNLWLILIKHTVYSELVDILLLVFDISILFFSSHYTSPILDCVQNNILLLSAAPLRISTELHTVRKEMTCSEETEILSELVHMKLRQLVHDFPIFA